MANLGFETLLGKDISEALFMGVMQSEVMNNIYTILNPKLFFFKKVIGQIDIETSEDKTITGLTIFIIETIDKSFYKTISDNYGYTSNVMVVDKLLQEESLDKINENNFTSRIKERITSLKKGSISDEHVKYVLWDKGSYQIMLHFGSGIVRFASSIY